MPSHPDRVRRNNERPAIIESCGNVFRDLGFPPEEADALMLKSLQRLHFERISTKLIPPSPFRSGCE